MKGGIFLFLLYFFFSHFVFLLPACCLPSKRSSNTKTSTVSTCETSQNFILPLEINPWKKQKQNETRVSSSFFLLPSSSFRLYPSHSVTHSLTRSYNKKWISSKSEELLGMKSNTFRHQSLAWWAQPILLRMQQHVGYFLNFRKNEN